MIELIVTLAAVLQSSRHYAVTTDGKVYIKGTHEVVHTCQLTPGRVLGEEGAEMYHVAVRTASTRVQCFPGNSDANYTYDVWHNPPYQATWYGSPLFNR